MAVTVFSKQEKKTCEVRKSGLRPFDALRPFKALLLLFYFFYFFMMNGNWFPNIYISSLAK